MHRGTPYIRVLWPQLLRACLEARGWRAGVHWVGPCDVAEGQDADLRPRSLSTPAFLVLWATSQHGIQEAGGLASAPSQPPDDGDEHGPQHISRPTPYTSAVPCSHLGRPSPCQPLSLLPPWLHVRSFVYFKPPSPGPSQGRESCGTLSMSPSTASWHLFLVGAGSQNSVPSLCVGLLGNGCDFIRGA